MDLPQRDRLSRPMGNVNNSVYRYLYPDMYPDARRPPTFDAEFGWPSGRKVRESPMSLDEMMKLDILDERRDYCVHKYVAHRDCIRKNVPFLGRCKHVRHEYHECENDNITMAHKEFERERRLMARRAKLRAERGGGGGGGRPAPVTAEKQ